MSGTPDEPDFSGLEDGEEQAAEEAIQEVVNGRSVRRHRAVLACRRCTSVARSRSTNTNRCLAPAPTARFRGRDASSAWCRSCHNGPSSATSSAITLAERPVILRSPVIAARDTVPTTRP